MDSLPFNVAPDRIFCIGSAAPRGERDTVSEDPNSIDYFFPGKDVAEAWNSRGERAVEYHDGSSVSTALAAGLASIIIYCANVMKAHHEAGGDTRASARFEKISAGLRDYRNMQKAFDNINSKGNSDEKFLPVWDCFGRTMKQMKSAEKGGKFDALEYLMNRLCGNIDV